MAGTSETNWVVEVDELLRRDDLQMALETPTSIFKLPDSVTKDNPQAYSPSRLFLGPLHGLTPELHKMEIFMLEQAKNTKHKFQLPELTQMVDQLKDLDIQIRSSYGGNLAIGSQALASRILIDGLFLLWLLGISTDEKKDEKKDEAPISRDYYSMLDGCYKIELPVFNEQELYLKLVGNITTMNQNEIVKDLLKLENQIPIQVLKRVLPKSLFENLHILFYKFCLSVSPLSLPSFDNPHFPTYLIDQFQDLSQILDQSQHLLHFLYSLLYYQRFLAYRQGVSAFDQRSGADLCELLNMMAKVIGVGFLQQLVDAVGLIQTLIGLLGKLHQSSPFANEFTPTFPSASKLRKVGVKFHGGSDGGFDVEDVTLTLPIFTMNAFSEVILRNLVAFEVEAKLSSASLSHYVKLMSGLIATGEDVRILKRAGIIAGDRSGNEDDVVKLFEGLGNALPKDGESSNQSSRSNFNSSPNFEVHIIEEINGYYESCWIVKAERFVKKRIFPLLQVLLMLVVVVLILIVVIRTVCGWFSCPKIMGHRIINTAYYLL